MNEIKKRDTEKSKFLEDRFASLEEFFPDSSTRFTQANAVIKNVKKTIPRDVSKFGPVIDQLVDTICSAYPALIESESYEEIVGLHAQVYLLFRYFYRGYMAGVPPTLNLHNNNTLTPTEQKKLTTLYENLNKLWIALDQMNTALPIPSPKNVENIRQFHTQLLQHLKTNLTKLNDVYDYTFFLAKNDPSGHLPENIAQDIVLEGLDKLPDFKAVKTKVTLPHKNTTPSRKIPVTQLSKLERTKLSHDSPQAPTGSTSIFTTPATLRKRKKLTPPVSRSTSITSGGIETSETFSNQKRREF